MNRTRILGRNPISGLNLLFLAVMLLALPMASRAQDTPIAQQVAKTFGIDSFGQIETMRYTWNVEFPDGRKIANKWEWSPKTDTVSYEGKDKAGNPVKVTYQRSKLDSQSDVVKKEIDPQFANDPSVGRCSRHRRRPAETADR